MMGVRIDVVTSAVVSSRPEMLELQELERWERLRYRADRDRLFTGVLLRRVVLHQHADRMVPVQRRCRGCGAVDHGEVQPSEIADRARWRTSLSHSGTVVMLAVAELEGADIDIGVDVESVSRLDSGMARHMLSIPERLWLSDPTPWQLCGIWTAKEAALKSLGCGLHASMTELELSQSSPNFPDPVVRVVGADHRLRPLRDRPSLVIDMTNIVSAVHGGETARRAALMVLGTEDVRLVHRHMTLAELWESATQASSFPAPAAKVAKYSIGS